MPPRLWAAVGYDGVFDDKHYKEAQTRKERDAPAPPVAKAMPLLNVFSEGWRNAQWYQRWANTLALAPGAARPAASLAVKGSGHQALCDLVHSLPHWLNKGLKNTLGDDSVGIGTAVNETVLAFLRNATVLDGPVSDLEEVPMTMGHVQA